MLTSASLQIWVENVIRITTGLGGNYQPTAKKYKEGIAILTDNKRSERKQSACYLCDDSTQRTVTIECVT